MSRELNKRYREELMSLANRMTEISDAADKAGEWSAEQRSSFDECSDRANVVEAKITELEADAQRAARVAALDEVDYRTVITGDEPDPNAEVATRDKAFGEAFGRFVRGGMDNVSSEQRNLMLEHRASPQGIGVPADGGYLVPPGYRAVMTESLKAYGGLINHANLITTSTGNPLQWPTNDDTGNIGAILSENSTVPELGMTIGTRSVGAYTYTSKLVRVSLQLLQDSAFDIDTWLPGKLGERIGRAVADDLVNGTGTGEPTGILPGATNFGGTAIGLAAFNANTSGAGYDAIINLEHSVDPAYRQMGNCRFIFNDNTLSTLRKFKDGDGRPLWLPVPVPGMPSTINGLPYTIDQSMPNAANPAKPILFGDFSAGYLVRQALDVQMVRLAERYAEMLQVGFFGFMRLDATPDDASAVRALNISGA